MGFEEAGARGTECGSGHADDHSNPFFEPWVLESARRHLLDENDCFLIIDRGGEPAVPVVIDRRFPRWCPTIGRIWAHKHCFDTTPVVVGRGKDDLGAFFESLAEHGVDMLLWRGLPLDTAVAARLRTFLKHARLACETTRQYQRPLLVRDDSDPERFLDVHIGKRRLKDLRRRRKRLEELGKVGLRTFRDQHDAAQWCRDFIELEASGWKGASGNGTAIACSAKERAFFEAMVARGAAKGRIVVHSLTLDGVPVAMTVNFRSGTWQWAYKTAYCEDVAHLAPGVQIEVEGSRAFLSDPYLTHFDACTDSEEGVMARLWPHRRPVADLLIATRPGVNHAIRTGGLLWRQYRALKHATRAKMKPLRALDPA